MALEEMIRVVEWIMHVRGFEHKTLETDGHKISYHEYGARNLDAPRVVLVHGLGNSSVVWYKMLGPLGKRYRVQALDLPGFGQSPAPGGKGYATVAEMTRAVSAFLAADPQPAILVGQSLGGWVSARVAIERPELVEQLVLINNAGVLYPQVHELRDLLMVTSREEIYAFWRRLWHRIPPINRLFVGDFIARVDAPMVSKFLDDVGPADFINEGLGHIRAPTTILWGVSDRFIPRLCVDIMLHGLTEARVVWLPKCGHIPQLERPKLVTRLIRDAIATPPPPPPPPPLPA